MGLLGEKRAGAGRGFAAASWLIVAGAALLGGCASTGDSGGPSATASASADSDSPTAADKFFGSSASPAGGLKPANSAYPSDYFLKQGYCPPVQIKPDTESFATYDKGHNADPAFLKSQASISKVARECHWNGDTLTIKVGVAGRIVAGPKGGPATVTLPVRIAVVKQLAAVKPLYSQMFKMPVTLAAPDFSADYSQVFDQVTLQAGPDDKDFVVYVGFDEGKPKT